ncbi:acetyltransferase [Pedobacter sp. Leaf250]|uniref:acetyltransferase n=1 Tax=Pedobacter sp. Leaf250 TaxID=2876559 RepID=UPI001E48D1F4|nr:acetyltransferase [Pedobacter sp. Leaf250]
MYLYGASGHGKVIAEIAEENKIIISAFIDHDLSKTKFLEYKVVHESPASAVSIVISIGNNLVRKKIVESHTNFNYKVLSHPKSAVSTRATIGEGSVIMAGATINSDAIIGKHCIINTNASVDHDCILKDFVHISPNSALAGNVQIGEGTHVGIGASIIQNVTIGKWCTIGAGAVVLRDVLDGYTVVGNPGKVIKISKDVKNR